jgi:DNA invertase Pin-like site-specific DNA recombinase
MKAQQTAILYVRVSSQKQAAEGLSLEAQERQLTAAAEAAGYSVRVFREEGRSGKSIKARPQLRAALAELEAGTAHALFVSRLDRLARSVSDLLSIIDLSQKQSWRLALMDMGLDTATPHGRLVVSMLASVAEFERGLIAERAKDTHAERRARGEVWGVTKGSKPLVSPELRKRILSEKAQGKSLLSIANALNAEGVPTVRGGKWHASTIKHLLEAPSSQQLSAA